MITTRVVDAEVTRPLRLAVLRPGLPSDSLVDPDGATHLAAVDGDAVLGAAVLIEAPWTLRPDARALQLRGMAVDPTVQRGGVGGRLLDAAASLAADTGVEILWCHARTSACGFYEKHGWHVEGEEYTGAIGLPHVLMWRNVSTDPPRPSSRTGQKGAATDA